MKNNFLSPNSVTGFLSVILGFTIIYLLPTQLEKPVLIFGQSSAEIDPELFPSFVAILLIIFVGILFGFAHIAFSDSWSDGKFAQATVGGIILGWVYLRYGIVVSLLIHWATNYFIFAYAHFISQINYVPLEIAFTNPLMSSLEWIFLFSGVLGVSILLLNKFYLKIF
ncbi:MAG TPA: CPBP family intramembrane metalloprotease [Nitrosopumilus sp.]|nr:CPBP family intramembrane metalloprotease [Nitrosopumilus sp.]